ncbi:hypothetical protein NDU88_001147 [Pleurodeles waltl]|uniref:Uncharacterized protein n=1 Tax=Pleurodeles waltl TaxID=8319 RepID=A0AAV7LGP9_PLEWA|nr:hypothetical protein NDU88_001147 [Pleurodeles waltl]
MLAMGKPRAKSQEAPQVALAPARQLTNNDDGDNLMPTTMQDTLNRVLREIEDTKLTLSQETGKVSAELSNIRMDHHKWVDSY